MIISRQWLHGGTLHSRPAHVVYRPHHDQYHWQAPTQGVEDCVRNRQCGLRHGELNERVSHDEQQDRKTKPHSQRNPVKSLGNSLAFAAMVAPVVAISAILQHVVSNLHDVMIMLPVGRRPACRHAHQRAN